MNKKQESNISDNSYNNSITIKIEGMSCSSCVAKVEKTIQKLGNATAQVNLVTNTALIEYGNNISIKEILETIKSLGYKVEIINQKNTNSQNINTKENNNHQTSNTTEESKVFASNQKQSTTNILNENTENNKTRKKNQIKNYKLFVSIILTILTLGIIIPMGENNRETIYIVAFISIVVSFWSGSIFHKNAYKNLKNFYLTMDSLVSLSIISAISWSIIQVFINKNLNLHNHFSLNILDFHNIDSTLHFDSAMMITTFILIGRYIENKAKEKGKSSLKNILDLEIKYANLIKNNKTIITSIDNIKPNDIVLVKNGETIPIDGIIIEGESELNTAMLTGETLPKPVKVKDKVIAGTINTFGMLKIRVTKTGQETMLSQIIKSIIDSQNQKPKIQKLVDKIATIFTPFIVIVSISATIFWSYKIDLNTAINIGITILVIACPCALGLATPMALIVSSGNATKHGILIKNLEVLEQTRKITTMIFDKTGTVTTGNLILENIQVCEDIDKNTLLYKAYIAEQGSEHPISKALTKYVNENNIIEKTKNTTTNISNHINYAGCGVEVTINNERIYMGKLKWIKNMGCEIPESLLGIIAQAQYTGSIVTILASYDSGQNFDQNNLKPLGIITFSDQIKPNTKTTIKYLHEQNINTLLVTGDTMRNATYVANKIGINENNIYSEVMPLNKKEIILKLQEQQENIAMIGDGINDAAALSQASTQGISFSFASGSDLAIYSSDITLLNENIELISKTFKIANKTIRIIKQNLIWAFTYNIIAIPMASLGYINPSIASISMVLSSLIVVTNSLRLQK